MTREEKVARAQELRFVGWGYKPIAAELGVGSGTIYRWLNPDHAEQQRAVSRAWKQNNKGECIDCGAPTNASRGHDAHLRCDPCARLHRHETRRWTPDAIIAAIQRFAERYGRPPVSADFLAGAGVKAHHRERYYSDGDYPAYSMLEREFGSFNAAITAAGFTPTAPGRYALTQRIGDDPAKVREAVAIYESGERTAVIAARYGVCRKTVLHWVHAAGVPVRPDKRVSAFTDNEMLAALLRAARNLGRTPKCRDFTGSSPSSAAIAARFGSWNAALEAAGLTPRHSSRPRAEAA